MAEWFVKVSESESDEGVIGPLRPSELLAMVRKGDVVPESKIRKDNSAWFEAVEVGGLFEAAIRPTISYFCPHCDSPIPEPPVVCAKCLKDVRKAREEIKENAISNRDDDSLRTQAGRSVQSWLKKKVQKKDQAGGG
ncbi:MAG: DUF4339 domain-containing protein [Pirellulaceae bacterium]|nr:DUF4339 domain-containing protein [Pirellulaceae bacterium]